MRIRFKKGTVSVETKKIVEYTRSLPVVNLSGLFIASSALEERFLELYIEFITKVLAEWPRGLNSKTYKTIYTFDPDKKDFLSLSEQLRNYIGFSGGLGIFSVEANESGTLSYSQKISFEGLLHYYLHGYEMKFGSYPVKSLIDRFLIWLWDKQLFLFPAGTKAATGKRHKDSWNNLVTNNFFWEVYKIGEESSGGRSLYYKTLFLLNVFLATRWRDAASVAESDIIELEKTMRTNELSAAAVQNSIGCLNSLRLTLINMGRKDINSPQSMKTKRYRESVEYVDDIDALFNDVDVVKNNYLSSAVDEARAFLRKRRSDQIMIATVRSDATAIKRFFEYWVEIHPGRKLSEELVVQMFSVKHEKDDKRLLFGYIKDNISEGAAYGYISTIAMYLDFAEVLTKEAKKNIPRQRLNPNRQSHRNVIKKAVHARFLEIVKQRPPYKAIAWNKHRADTNWWPHEVYPVLPLMLLFNLHIPIRGGQVRWLCREKSIVLDKNGEVKSFVINTDKNVSRKELQEIPCVWEDLRIFSKFLKWHKEYFYALKPLLYQKDENSPWGDIYPLFNMPKSLQPVDKRTHFIYFKRVMCQAQIELDAEGVQNKTPNIYKIAWGDSFPRSVAELEEMSDEKINEFSYMYDIHTLRITGATRYLQAGLDYSLVMLLTGHTSASTLLRVYIKMEFEEKLERLKQIAGKVNIVLEKPTTIDDAQKLILGDITKAAESGSIDAVLRILGDNGMFAMPRKVSIKDEKASIGLAQEAALQNHPTMWYPMIHGICPGVKCPEGREDKCSLCPYLLTGRLFLNGVVHQANLSLAKFARIANDIALDEHNKKTSAYEARSKAESAEVALEEAMGWWDIIGKIEESVDEELTSAGVKSLPIRSDKVSDGIVETREMPDVVAHLENAYAAKSFGVDYDRFGLKVLTIKAVRLAHNMRDDLALSEILNNETKSVDFLMSHYTKSLDSGNIKGFMEKLGYKKPSRFAKLT